MGESFEPYTVFLQIVVLGWIDYRMIRGMQQVSAKRVARRFYANTIGFHGWKMSPDTMRLEGPHFSDQKPIPESDVQEAVEWLETEDPNTLVAYSRGGAVAMIALREADSNPRVIYVAPAWRRGWANISSPPKTTGDVIHGDEDAAVPLQHSCDLAQRTGMPLHVFPGRNHVNILKDKLNPGSGIKMPPQKIKECVDSCPDWGTGQASPADLEEQKRFVQNI
jgi:hypothetical protein